MKMLLNSVNLMKFIHISEFLTTYKEQTDFQDAFCQEKKCFRVNSTISVFIMFAELWENVFYALSYVLCLEPTSQYGCVVFSCIPEKLRVPSRILWKRIHFGWLLFNFWSRKNPRKAPCSLKNSLKVNPFWMTPIQMLQRVCKWWYC